MINLNKLNDWYEISYNPLEGYEYLYVQHKNDEMNVDNLF